VGRHDSTSVAIRSSSDGAGKLSSVVNGRALPVNVLPMATPIRRVPKSNASTIASGFLCTRDHP
jgi:hypothetical protein